MSRINRPTLLALSVIVVIAALLRLYGLGAMGYGNLYYAATVRSMLDSWHNFLFASFEPGGSIAVDKPPLGFWIQCASAALLGVNGFALALPQALAGIAAVPLMFLAVRRTFGDTAALLAALVVAATPVSIATDRNNTIDGLLIPLTIVAAWAALRGAETGRLRWLLLCAGLVGLGFNIKMLQAYLPLPAFFGVYLLTARTSGPRRIGHLFAAGAVTLVVSLSWAVFVDLTPADQRPFVGSSDNNTVMNLIVNHNGLRRVGSLALLGGPAPAPPPAQPGPVPQPANAPGPAAPAGRGEIGQPSMLRLAFEPLAGQASWLLPLALFGLIAAAVSLPLRPLDARHRALLVWGAWLITELIFFSVASMFHRYYLEMLVPPIAALTGAGVVALWQSYARPGIGGWLLPAALLATAGQQWLILAEYRETQAWLAPVLVLVAGLACGLAALRAWRGARGQPRGAFAAPLVAALIAAVFAAPLAWATMTALSDAGRAMLPSAGPAPSTGGTPGGPGLPAPINPAPPPGGEVADAQLVRYLQAHTADTAYLAATISANEAAPLILATNRPVLALGGFSGGDRVYAPRDLESFVARGAVRFFLVGADRARGPQNDLVTWIEGSCSVVPASALGGPRPGGITLYRCDR